MYLTPNNSIDFKIILNQKQQLAKKIVLRYSQRWISYFDKRKLMFNDDKVKPRHLSTGKCLCQFVEEHFRNNKLEAKNDLHEEERALHEDNQGNGQTLTAANGIGCQSNSQKQSINDNNTNRTSDDDQKDLIQVKKSRNGIFTRNNNQLTTLSHVVDMQQYANQSETISDDFSDDNIDDEDDNQEDIDSVDRINLANERTASSTSPVTDVSSDLDGTTNSGELLSNDDLIKKLRFILELRKNDLNGSFGGSYEQQYYQHTFLNGYKQHTTSIVLNDDDQDEFGIYNNNNHRQLVMINQQHDNRKYKLGKVGLLTPSSLKATFAGKNKFFNQSSKKDHHQQSQVNDNNVKQVLEIF